MTVLSFSPMIFSPAFCSVSFDLLRWKKDRNYCIKPVILDTKVLVLYTDE